jgi:hypothetical protein
MSYGFIVLNAVMRKSNIAMTNPDQEVTYMTLVNVFILKVGLEK